MSDSIDRETLRDRIERGRNFVLVDARSPMAFAISHLPGAVNLPLIWVDERAHRRIGDPETEVVVYCESVTCESSAAVAARLRELGYRNVSHYAEGHRGWVAAGLPLDDSRVL